MPQAKLGTWAWEEGGTEASEAGVSALPGPMAVGELVGPARSRPAPGVRAQTERLSPRVLVSRAPVTSLNALPCR